MKEKVYHQALLKLNEEINEYEEVRRQKYFQHARLMFKVRANIVDIKACRSYKYNDTVCRLCGSESEDIQPRSESCTKVPRPYNIENYGETSDLDI